MFRKLFATVSILALAAFFVPSPALSDSVEYSAKNELVQVTSRQSFDNTVAKLKKLISKNGMMVMGEVNQGKIMSMTGTSLKAVSLFVGSPMVGKKLFNENVGSAVAAPFRVTVYKAKNGEIIISYYKPSHLLAAFDGEKISKIAQMLDKKLAMLTDNAGK
jgi:uncharacterized protein (DUF302 family)